MNQTMQLINIHAEFLIHGSPFQVNDLSDSYVGMASICISSWQVNRHLSESLKPGSVT